MQVLWKAGVYSERKSYIFEISSDYKLNARAVKGCFVFIDVFLIIVIVEDNYWKDRNVHTSISMAFFIGIFLFF